MSVTRQEVSNSSSLPPFSFSWSIVFQNNDLDVSALAVNGSGLTGKNVVASVIKKESKADYPSVGSFRLRSGSNISAEISVASTDNHIQRVIRSLSKQLHLVTVSDGGNSSSFRAWDVTFPSLEAALVPPDLAVSSVANGTAVEKVNLVLLSSGWSIPLYTLNLTSSVGPLGLYWQNSSYLGNISVSMNVSKVESILKSSGIFSYLKVDKVSSVTSSMFYFLLIPSDLANSSFNIADFHVSRLSVRLPDSTSLSALPLAMPMNPIQSLNASVSFTLHDEGCLENNGGVFCSGNLTEEATSPLKLPISSDTLAAALETLRDIKAVNVSSSSLRNSFNEDDGGFILEGVRYTITFIEATTNSTATAATALNEFTWSPVRDSIRYGGQTEQVYAFPALSVIPVSTGNSASRRRLQSVGANSGFVPLSVGWQSSVRVTQKGQPPGTGNATTAPVEITMNGQEYTTSGRIRSHFNRMMYNIDHIY